MMTLTHAIGSGATTIAWSEASPLGGQPGSALYDLLRSADAADFTTATCLQSQAASLTTTDTTTPAAGAVVFFLSRAANACPGGVGTLGFASSATERVGASCP